MKNSNFSNIKTDPQHKSFDRTRKSSLNNPSVCTNCQKTSPEDKFYQRNIEWMKNKENKTKIKKLQKINEEAKNCSFVPKITCHNSMFEESNNTSFYERNIQWKQAKEEKKKQLKDQILEKEMAEMKPTKVHKKVNSVSATANRAISRRTRRQNISVLDGSSALGGNLLIL